MRFATTHSVSPKFPDCYVTALRNQFYPHALTVLGDGEDHDAPLKAFLPGWGCKAEWFAPWNRALLPAVVFDLDTFIVGDVTPFLKLDPTRLWMIRQFYQRPEIAKAESGIFVAPDNDALCDAIWQAAQVFDFKHGDGALMRKFPHAFIPDQIDGILSYKVHKLQDRPPPPSARVVCFHGKPAPADVASGWARDWWQTSLNSRTKSC